METIQVACYSDAPNGVIVQTPGRQFPGLVFQGDTLKNLYRKAERAIAAFDKGDSQETRDYLLDLVEIIHDKLVHYEIVLKENSMQLPYPDPISESAN